MVASPAFIGGVGGPEIFFALAIALVLFGPKRLPEIARKLSKVSGQLRNVNRQIQRELYSNLDPDEILRERGKTPPKPVPAPSNVEQGADPAEAPRSFLTELEEQADHDAPDRDAGAERVIPEAREALSEAGGESDKRKADPEAPGPAE